MFYFLYTFLMRVLWILRRLFRLALGLVVLCRILYYFGLL